MTNLSGKKRQQMLEFLEKIKEGLSDETSLSTVRDIEEELTTRKYGLVWEKHEERIDQEMQTKVPVFTEIKERRISIAGQEDGYHYLLEGDNLHSLRLLGETCRKKVDCIYIDPPYNTGNKDFIYDDAIVDEKDGFRHSKWLSFMSERLEAAKELLADNGVIFISIDDNEVYALKLLCDEIMGEQNFVTNIIWQKKTGASDARGIATITEYILVYVKDIRRADQIFDKS